MNRELGACPILSAEAQAGTGGGAAQIVAMEIKREWSNSWPVTTQLRPLTPQSL